MSKNEGSIVSKLQVPVLGSKEEDVLETDLFGRMCACCMKESLTAAFRANNLVALPWLDSKDQPILLHRTCVDRLLRSLEAGQASDLAFKVSRLVEMGEHSEYTEKVWSLIAEPILPEGVIISKPMISANDIWVAAAAI